MRKRRASSIIAPALRWIVTLAILLVFNSPILGTIITSFKTKADISSMPPKWIFHPVLEHYQNVLYAFGYDFPKFFQNSIVVSLGTSLLVLAVCLPAAYSIVRYDVGGGRPLIFVVSLRLLPVVVFTVPIFILFQYVRLLDTRIGLILMNSLVSLPIALLLLVGFIQDLPRAIEEAAMIDGASTPRLLWHIVLPLILPGLGAATMLTFVWTWNEYLLSLVLTLRKATTVTVGASLFVTAWEVQWGEIAAAITLSVIPTLIFVMLTQRHLIRAISFGFLK
ncbi:MAG TPA: carbohydrate ABC transporter permease [Firmicutes bacterium]|nr:carbohydrate ABC transporter permease [Bacillota bacterium]